MALFDSTNSPRGIYTDEEKLRNEFNDRKYKRILKFSQRQCLLMDGISNAMREWESYEYPYDVQDSPSISMRTGFNGSDFMAWAIWDNNGRVFE